MKPEPPAPAPPPAEVAPSQPEELRQVEQAQESEAESTALWRAETTPELETWEPQPGELYSARICRVREGFCFARLTNDGADVPLGDVFISDNVCRYRARGKLAFGDRVAVSIVRNDQSGSAKWKATDVDLDVPEGT